MTDLEATAVRVMTHLFNLSSLQSHDGCQYPFISNSDQTLDIITHLYQWTVHCCTHTFKAGVKYRWTKIQHYMMDTYKTWWWSLMEVSSLSFLPLFWLWGSWKGSVARVGFTDVWGREKTPTRWVKAAVTEKYWWSRLGSKCCIKI